jgi:hypothetical protein
LTIQIVRSSAFQTLKSQILGGNEPEARGSGNKKGAVSAL